MSINKNISSLNGSKRQANGTCWNIFCCGQFISSKFQYATPYFLILLCDISSFINYIYLCSIKFSEILSKFDIKETLKS